MLYRCIQKWRARLVASQLRRPSGLLARRAAKAMNQANAGMYAVAKGALRLEPGHQLLEIGFGNGAFFQEIFDAHPEVSITGVEFAPQMVREAHRRYPEAVQRGRLNVLQGNSDCLPFADGRFDRMLCVNLIYFWEHPEEHLAEIRRVLKPGGLWVCSFRPKDHLEAYPFARHGFTHYSEAEWRSRLEAAGFTWIDSEYRKEPISHRLRESVPFESVCLVVQRC